MTCTFGTVWQWPHVCAACDAYGKLLQRQFVQAVMDGTFDRWGFTKAEKKKKIMALTLAVGVTAGSSEPREVSGKR